MSAVFDRTSVGQRLAHDRETDSYLGEHPNVVRHQQRMAERIDAERAKEPDAVFGPEVTR
jgi:hypothetical protein